MRSLAYFLIALFGAACHTPAAPAPSPSKPAILPKVAVCPVLPEHPERIAVPDPIPGELHEFFDLADESSLFAPAPTEPEWEQYRAALLSRIGSAEGLSYRALLERAKAGRGVKTDTREYREGENAVAVLEGKAGSVSPISCLEWRLFQRQARRFPMIEHPTEFGAYLLRGEGRFRVYFSGADFVGGKLRGEVRDRVIADVARGFIPVAHLHNHNFMFDRKPGDRMWTTETNVNDIQGGVAPSLTDVQAYRAMRETFGLRGAWVTNGLDTAHFVAGDFDVLSAWE